jgi:hypothetical protein
VIEVIDLGDDLEVDLEVNSQVNTTVDLKVKFKADSIVILVVDLKTCLVCSISSNSSLVSDEISITS